MPDTIEPGSDTVRDEVVRSAVAALDFVAPALSAGVDLLLPRLHAAIPTPELARMSPEALAASTASLWSLAAQRGAGEALVRVTPRGAGGIAEIVTDDMPYLVDSALAVLSRAGRVIHRVLHPVLTLRRDAAGTLLDVVSAATPGAKRESLMRIEFGATGRAAAATSDTVEAALLRALADVRIVNAEQAAMRDLLSIAKQEIAGSPTPEAKPAQRFLDWLLDDNLLLLGHRHVAVHADGDLQVTQAESLGLLRDPAVTAFDTLRDMAAIPPGVRAAMLRPEPLVVAKANLRSTVHRPQHCDALITRSFDPDGQVLGLRVFLGLFAGPAYTRNPRSIPMFAEKVNAMLAAAGLDLGSHDGRALRDILDTWPRDELFQAPQDAILAGARRALDLQLRPRTALVLRHDPFERFVSAIVWLPRDVYNSQLRERVGGMLARAFGGSLATYYTAVGDEPLARINYILATTPGGIPAVDADALEQAVVQTARDFRDRLADALEEAHGEGVAARLIARWGDAFPGAYREGCTSAQGVADLALAEQAMADGRAAVRLERTPGAAADHLTLRLANPGAPLALADALPLLDSLDLRAIEEIPYYLTTADGDRVVLQVFALQAATDAPHAVFDRLLEAVDALLTGRTEPDGFNRLVLRAGLGWRECWLLRTLYRWLKQVGFAFSQSSVEDTLAAQPAAARLLVDLFHARFAPGGASEDGLEACWSMLLDEVANPDEDRILTRLMTLLCGIVRTNYYEEKPYLVLKIDSAAAGEMPLPRPWREIFVHSPRMEGCHLRAGPVARGGIRWSDRREDFRTEILGLMKAQRLKNVVIVPTGAKGGFVLKQPPAPGDREALLAEGIACYRILINAMVDMADNLDGDRVITPADIVRRDADDPYIVAAADKGTATFSDIANGIAMERGFWLGDAFASGGSQGYDHKVMGITAKGAWVMIARHFAERGLDIQADRFTCVGVGDMSGDVFGNGLLVSRQTRLLAAFDHRHIFLDPDPDDAAYDERMRMFTLPRSAWSDYDPAKISAGGGVFSRAEKRIPLSPQARAILGIAADHATPAEVMQAILRAPVDLLYFGGIGTYVKASGETQAEVGDRANDAIRVNGCEVRAKVLGEGANLAITQAGRIEAAQGGVRLNTDALDNSAGVSTSDHEVNIKILLADAVAAGALTLPQRDALLTAMTDELGNLVLAENRQQALTVSLDEARATEALPDHAALMTLLETAGLLDRAVEGLPDPPAVAVRTSAGAGLTRPEIATLLPTAKLWITDAIEASTLPDEPALLPLLVDYFPTQLRQRFGTEIRRHRLRRQLIATMLANLVVNRLGLAALARLTAAAAPEAVARSAWLAGALFGMDTAIAELDAAATPWAARRDALLALRGLQEAATHSLLTDEEAAQPLDQALAALRPGVDALVAEASTPDIDPALPPGPARLAAAVPDLAPALGVLRLAREAGTNPGRAARAWATVGRDILLDALRGAALRLPTTTAFDARARTVVLDELERQQIRFVRQALGGHPLDTDSAAKTLREATASGGLAAITVALRALEGVGGTRPPA